MPIMLDLETLGQRAGCAIISIGACEFDPKAKTIGRTFYGVAAADGAQGKAGLTVDPKTWDWWQKQSAEARAVFSDANAVPINVLLTNFVVWADQCKGVSADWYAHGASFDFPVLEAVLLAFKFKTPWSFWNCRCTRTLYALGDVAVNNYRDASAHNALADAKAQAQAAIVALGRIGIAREIVTELTKPEGSESQ